MTKITTIECLECGHDHEIEIVRGETEWDDYAEVPEQCEECGAELGDDIPSDASLRASERRQMGICF